MNLIDNLNWRYATKKFDSSRRIEEKHIELLKESIRLSASSYGFQPYKIIIISQEELRKKLQPHTWGQSQVVEASHLFLFCSQLDFTEAQVDEYLSRKAINQGIPIKNLKGYADFMKGKIAEKSSEIMQHWTAKQTYIAMTNLITACAELKIDSCPLEGFDALKYDEILELKEKGLTTSVLAAVGYRSEEDKSQYLKKVRKSSADLFHLVK